MPGRIGVYIHSDAVTQNKAAGIVQVFCETDFAARTDEFIKFADSVAKYAVGFQTEEIEELEDLVPGGIEPKRLTLAQELGEIIVIEEIHVTTIVPPPQMSEAEYLKRENEAYAQMTKLGAKNGNTTD